MGIPAHHLQARSRIKMKDAKIALCLILMQLSNSICFQCPGYDIPRKFRCDGLNNCGDNSDEDGCPAGFLRVDDELSDKDKRSIGWLLDIIAAKEKGEPLPPPPDQGSTDIVSTVKAGLIGQNKTEQSNSTVSAGLIGQKARPKLNNVVMLTTGFGGISKRKNGKVATFLNPNTGANIVCNTGDFPDGIQEATGNLIDGMPLLCGGIGGERSERYNKSSNCYILRDGTWSQFTNMTEKRQTPSSAVVTKDGKEALFVTGGYDNDNHLKTTEFVFSDGKVLPGPDLPEGRTGHCTAQLDENRYIIMGGNLGKSGRKTNTTIIWDSTTNEFTDGPSMEYTRKTFACTVFWSDLHYSPVVIAAGGSGKNATGTRAGNRAEIWILNPPTRPKVFEKTSELPQLMTGGPNIIPNTKGGGILTFDKKVFELTCTHSGGCKWKHLKKQNMAIPCRYHVGISIPANTVVKC